MFCNAFLATILVVCFYQKIATCAILPLKVTQDSELGYGVNAQKRSPVVMAKSKTYQKLGEVKKELSTGRDVTAPTGLSRECGALSEEEELEFDAKATHLKKGN